MTEMNKKNFEELENLDYFAVQGEGSTTNKVLIKRALATAKKNLENAEGICIFSNEPEQDVVLFVNSEEAVSRFLKKKRDEIFRLTERIIQFPAKVTVGQFPAFLQVSLILPFRYQFTENRQITTLFQT